MNQLDEILVSDDFSSFDDKLSILKRLGYAGRSRWGNNTKIIKLPTDASYLRDILLPKESIEEHTDRRPENNSIIQTSILKHRNSDNLYATIAHIVAPNTSQFTSPFVTNDRYASCFSVSLHNTNTSQSTGRQNKIITNLEIVDLFRYDAFQRPHPNITNVFGGGAIELVYEKYFRAIAPAPHFHFCNRTLIEAIGKTAAEVNAINIKDLIRYIKDLSDDKHLISILNTYDFGMPYLLIKKHPKLYSTPYETIREIKKFQKMKGDLQLANLRAIKINKSLFNFDENKKQIYGLEAVYYDLVLLELLYNTGGNLLAQMKLASKISGFNITFTDDLTFGR